MRGQNIAAKVLGLDDVRIEQPVVEPWRDRHVAELRRSYEQNGYAWSHAALGAPLASAFARQRPMFFRTRVAIVFVAAGEAAMGGGEAGIDAKRQQIVRACRIEGAVLDQDVGEINVGDRRIRTRAERTLVREPRRSAPAAPMGEHAEVVERVKILAVEPESIEISALGAVIVAEREPCFAPERGSPPRRLRRFGSCLSSAARGRLGLAKFLGRRSGELAGQRREEALIASPAPDRATVEGLIDLP